MLCQTGFSSKAERKGGRKKRIPPTTPHSSPRFDFLSEKIHADMEYREGKFDPAICLKPCKKE